MVNNLIFNQNNPPLLQKQGFIPVFLLYQVQQVSLSFAISPKSLSRTVQNALQFHIALLGIGVPY